MRFVGSLALVLLWAFGLRIASINIPLEVEQPPTIINHTSSPVIVLPFENTLTIRCEARGNPPPEYRWTKDGQLFEFLNISTIKRDNKSGTFMLHSKHFIQFQGKYRCFASNKLGTAMTEEIEIKVLESPRFPKEYYNPIVVKEGEPITLHCNPPKGVPPLQIYWMNPGLHHIEQDERVSMGTEGNLYFSYALLKDSHEDYCCFAAFQKIRIIVQKTAQAVKVERLKADNYSSDGGNITEHLPVKAPSLLLPSSGQTTKVLRKGEDLQLECIPGGFPIPKITWMKLGKSLTDRVKLTNFERLLTITSVDQNDEGEYTCTAKNSAGKVDHYFSVRVEEPPAWITAPPQSLLSVVGSDVHIHCSVSGFPPPVITWRRNGKIFRDEPQNNRQVLDDTVVIRKARSEDGAVYQCEASNSHGSILANINLLVMNTAPLILTKDSQEYEVIVGGDVIINCTVFSSPPSNISWNKEEKAVEWERFQISESGQALKIISTEKDDSGKYVCEAGNTEGTSTLTAVLNVKDPTKIVSPPQDIQVISGTSARLMCEAEYDESLQDTFEVLWRKDGVEILLSSEENFRYSVKGGLLQIMNVNLSDQGTYTCIAKTHLDEDAATAVLTVLDVPDAPTKLKISDIKSETNIVLTWVPGSDHNSSITEFVVEYEESHWEAGRWKELQKVVGNQATAELFLQGNLNYQFRVYAVNAIGPGPPSETTERYPTPPAAPDRNPENIKIQGHLPHQMDISWDPLLPIEYNGPGLEYNVSYRKLGVQDDWKMHLVQRPSFIVKDTPTFVPYEIKVQSRNSFGSGPEPKTVTGYSGEDVPTAAPQDVAVEMINSTAVIVSWTPVPPATVRGHLGGYNVYWQRLKSLLNPGKILNKSDSQSFPGNRSHVIVPGLEPFSEYKLTVNVFNKKGKGPRSDPVTFNTPEGVPGSVPILTTSNTQKNSVLLVWGPPLVSNGILSGYFLLHHLLNETSQEVIDSQETNITGADITRWELTGLKEGSLYRFHLSACTQAGCGPPQAQESRTVQVEDPSRSPAVAPVQNNLNCSLTVPSSITGNSSHFPLVPALLNISSYVSDTFAKISWTTEEEQEDFQLYVAYMNKRDGNWHLSEAVNTSQNFHIIDGLKPGTLYTVRLMAKKLLDNANLFEDVIQTRVTGVTSRMDGISTQRWFIGTLCAVALLTLIVLMACFVRKNKGGKYAVKEKEDLFPDEESQGMNDEFLEYSDSDEKPLKRTSLCSRDDAVGDSISRDSLVDYADGEGEFNEDGSFIGEYCGPKYRSSICEPNGPSPISA
ncbi:neural cell adhesion molecule L1-like protein isoform X2 [Kryptolebias marmoratus]|uniref:neural cell adhesion molecule L1-like protein isoform X2 n=1 Tax=Kryptolebias marmoratus TaxID=37003 RepID=UPI0018ACD8E7|nr:neural cell adhesion molecule L1-like protein isoform X2 [Kryptolebias marmoratus]